MAAMYDDLSLLADLHLGGDRQGPGSPQATRLAITLAGLKNDAHLNVADIGCGTGASARILAQDLGAQVTAIDLLQPFIDAAAAKAEEAGLADRITTCAASMEALPFDKATFDLIWSEGAIYNMGFAAGLRAWRPLLKTGGVLAVSDLTWLTAERPAPLTDHWQREYPQVDTASARMALLEGHGFSTLGYFTLPPDCWLDHYYRPLQSRFAAFLARHDHSDAARAIIAGEEAEIALYEQYQAFFSYGFYIARRVD